MRVNTQKVNTVLKRLYQQNKYKFIFIVNISIVLFLTTVGFFIFWAIKGSVPGLFRFISRYLMSDFGQVMYFTISENPYITNFPTSYLPLCFVLVKPFALICKTSPKFYEFDNIPIEDNTYSYEQLLQCNVSILSTWQFWVAIMSFFAICFAIIGVLLYRFRKWERKSDFVYLYLSIIFSGFFVVGIIRGTNVFLCLIFALIFISFYKSEKAWLREIALISLAVCGVLKIYPLLFGVLLLREKKFFASVRVAIYFFILAVLPFAMYGNVWENAVTFVENLVTFAVGENRMGDAMNISVISLVCGIFSLFGISGTAVSVISYLLAICCLCACVYVGIVSKSRCITYLILCIGLLIIPPVSYYYVSMFMVLPIIYLIDEWNTLDKDRKIYTTVFLSFMAFVPLSITSWYIPHCLFGMGIVGYESIKLIRRNYCHH